MLSRVNCIVVHRLYQNYNKRATAATAPALIPIFKELGLAEFPVWCSTVAVAWICPSVVWEIAVTFDLLEVDEVEVLYLPLIAVISFLEVEVVVSAAAEAVAIAVVAAVVALVVVLLTDD